MVLLIVFWFRKTFLCENYLLGFRFLDLDCIPFCSCARIHRFGILTELAVEWAAPENPLSYCRCRLLAVDHCDVLFLSSTADLR